MVTAEPTGGVVCHANRGAITLRIETRGTEAHVGQAPPGVYAFEKMIRVAESLGALAGQLLERQTAFPMESDAVRGSMLVVGGSAVAGANFNVVPGSAWFSVDRRFNPEEDLDEELVRLTDTIADAAARAGADVTALCDTNGGMLPGWVGDVVNDVVETTGVRVGIHCHNDTGCAVANTLAAVDAGATHVQGTLNGYGERTGNADLVSVVANLELKLSTARRG